MGYSEALVAAGAEVLDFEEFGDYQGTWYAVVRLDGNVMVVTGSYGSCSGCDAYQSEFDCEGHYEQEDYMGKYHSDWNLVEGCERCDKIREHLIEFGKHYLDDAMTIQEGYAGITRDIDWGDYEIPRMVDWLTKTLVREGIDPGNPPVITMCDQCNIRPAKTGQNTCWACE